jgi:GST-like protein
LHGRQEVLQWLFWQVGGLGPMLGQNHHFTQYAQEKVPYAIERYVKETARLYAVLNKQLSQYEFMAGEYSIADMACYPWILLYEKQQQRIEDFPHVKRWMEQVQKRPAVQRAYAKAAEINASPTMTDEAKKILFGQDAKLHQK